MAWQKPASPRVRSAGGGPEGHTDHTRAGQLPPPRQLARKVAAHQHVHPHHPHHRGEEHEEPHGGEVREQGREHTPLAVPSTGAHRQHRAVVQPAVADGGKEAIGGTQGLVGDGGGGPKKGGAHGSKREVQGTGT